MVIRQTVHLDIHFKRLGRGLAANLVLVVLHHAEQVGVMFNFCHKGLAVPFAHPPAQYIERFLMFFDTGGHFAHIKVGGKRV